MQTTILFQQFNSNGIRANDQGQYSILDTIKICGKKNPRDAWNRLKTEYPEVVEISDNFQFPGKGQRPTPVTDKEGILYILGLLPGTIGKSFRKEQAKLVRQYLEADPELTGDLIDRSSEENLDYIEKRLQAKKVRNEFTRELKERGLRSRYQFGECTNQIYSPILGGKASTLREKYNLAPRANLREFMDSEELVSVEFAELASMKIMAKQKASNFRDCRYACACAGHKVKAFMESL